MERRLGACEGVLGGARRRVKEGYNMQRARVEKRERGLWRRSLRSISIANGQCSAWVKEGKIEEEEWEKRSDGKKKSAREIRWVGRKQEDDGITGFRFNFSLSAYLVYDLYME